MRLDSIVSPVLVRSESSRRTPLRLSEAPDRDHVLVHADEPLQELAAEVVRNSGLVPLVCKTPLDAIQLLEKHGPRIGHAILSTRAHGGLDMRTLLADEHPTIKVFVVDG
jgi:hypothetical protein